MAIGTLGTAGVKPVEDLVDAPDRSA